MRYKRTLSSLVSLCVVKNIAIIVYRVSRFWPDSTRWWYTALYEVTALGEVIALHHVSPLFVQEPCLEDIMTHDTNFQTSRSFRKFNKHGLGFPSLENLSWQIENTNYLLTISIIRCLMIVKILNLD